LWSDWSLLDKFAATIVGIAASAPYINDPTWASSRKGDENDLLEYLAGLEDLFNKDSAKAMESEYLNFSSDSTQGQRRTEQKEQTVEGHQSGSIEDLPSEVSSESDAEDQRQGMFGRLTQKMDEDEANELLVESDGSSVFQAKHTATPSKRKRDRSLSAVTPRSTRHTAKRQMTNRRAAPSFSESESEKDTVRRS
jgi:hypothetical protein